MHVAKSSATGYRGAPATPYFRTLPRSRCTSCPASSESTLSIAVTEAQPKVVVKFEQKEGGPVQMECESGEQLRAAMLDNKVDLYTTWGKIWSCGGAGQCGTCIVQVLEGADLLSERTATEERKLAKKPESWRLACQCIVGDGTTSGTVVLRTKPQA